MSAHALLGPSSAKQWMTCTPSARFGEGFSDKSSEYADQGSAAHQLAEMWISGRATFEKLPGFISHDEWTTQYGNFVRLNKFYDEEMDGLIREFAQWTVNLIREKKDPMLLLEQKLDLSRWIPGGFGTGDVIILDEGLMEVIDLKYGRGVKVETDDNPQLKCYALGAIEAFSILYDFDRVRVTIYQPRLMSEGEEPSSVEYTVDELLKWADTELAPAAKLAWSGHGDYVPGEHCKFCRGRTHCEARMEAEVKSAFDDDFRDPDELVSEDVNVMSEKDRLYWLLRSDSIIKWLGDLQKYELKEAVSGRMPEGFKLVEGRSNRIIQNRPAVSQILSELPNPSRFFKPVDIIALGALEIELGKKDFTKLLGEFVIKPSGKPKLVPESDKRPAMNSDAAAQTAFEDDED